jgi:hypothetical protein
VPVKPSDFYSNTKSEDIACRPIRPAYDGTNAKLLIFLNKLHLQHQNEDWGSSTYFNNGNVTYDLTKQFTTVKEAGIKQAATA